MLKFWCSPFSYSESEMLADLTPDEDEGIKNAIWPKNVIKVENIRDKIEYKDLNFDSVFRNSKECHTSSNSPEKSLKRTSICSRIIHHTLNSTQIDSGKCDSLYQERNKKKENSNLHKNCETLRSPKYQSNSPKNVTFENDNFEIYDKYDLEENRDKVNNSYNQCQNKLKPSCADFSDTFLSVGNINQQVKTKTSRKMSRRISISPASKKDFGAYSENCCDQDVSCRSNRFKNISKQLKFAISFTTPNTPLSTPIQLRKEIAQKPMLEECDKLIKSNNKEETLSYGKICLKITYEIDCCILTASILQSMMALANKNSINNYKKIQFHISLFNTREKSQRFKTSIKDVLEIVKFNECFYFENVEKYDLENASILISLYGFAFFNSEKLLSQALFPLKNLNVNEENYATLHMENVNVSLNENLKMSVSNNFTNLVQMENNFKAIECTNNSSDKRLIDYKTKRPYLLIGLKYIKNDDQDGGILFVKIFEGKNFFDRSKPDKLPNTFVKSVLALDNNEMFWETTVKKATGDPVFNEDFKFKIDSCHLKSARLLIFVYSVKIFARRNCIGCILFDEQSGHRKSLEHYNQAVKNCGEYIQKWHPLIQF